MKRRKRNEDIVGVEDLRQVSLNEKVLLQNVNPLRFLFVPGRQRV